MTYWSNIYWPWFLGVTFVLFIIPETYALITNAANTLSEYCWRELDVTHALEFSSHSVAWWGSLIPWLMFAVIITLHIWFRVQ